MNSSDYEFLKDLNGGFMYRNVPFCKVTSQNILQKVEKFEFRSSDVLISAYPKTGTHLVSEIVSWLVCPEKCRSVHSGERVPFIEMYKHLELLHSKKQTIPAYIDINEDYMEMFEKCSTQRLFKTHLKLDFLSPSIFTANPKIIHTFRNPFDTAVSFYNFYKKIDGLRFKGTWDEFFELFMNGHIIFGDFFEHTKSWSSAADKLNIHVAEYESILTNPHEEVRKIAEFLELSGEISDEMISNIVDQCSFSKMKSNPLIHESICRKGVVGDWKNYFNNEQENILLKKFNQVLTPLGIKIKY